MESDDVLMQQLAVIDDLSFCIFGEPCTSLSLYIFYSHHLLGLAIAHEAHGAIPTRPQLTHLQGAQKKIGKILLQHGHLSSARQLYTLQKMKRQEVLSHAPPQKMSILDSLERAAGRETFLLML